MTLLHRDASALLPCWKKSTRILPALSIAICPAVLEARRGCPEGYTVGHKSPPGRTPGMSTKARVTDRRNGLLVPGLPGREKLDHTLHVLPHLAGHQRSPLQTPELSSTSFMLLGKPWEMKGHEQPAKQQTPPPGTGPAPIPSVMSLSSAEAMNRHEKQQVSRHLARRHLAKNFTVSCSRRRS